jgi:hypothetical protein
MQVGIFTPTTAYEGGTVGSPMITVQILILLLTVIAAVSVAALRLKIPPAILLVISGVLLALFPGTADRQFGSRLRAFVRAAADHLCIGGGNELERI